MKKILIYLLLILLVSSNYSIFSVSAYKTKMETQIENFSETILYRKTNTINITNQDLDIFIDAIAWFSPVGLEPDDNDRQLCFNFLLNYSGTCNIKDIFKIDIFVYLQDNDNSEPYFYNSSSFTFGYKGNIFQHPWTNWVQNGEIFENGVLPEFIIFEFETDYPEDKSNNKITFDIQSGICIVGKITSIYLPDDIVDFNGLVSVTARQSFFSSYYDATFLFKNGRYRVCAPFIEEYDYPIQAKNLGNGKNILKRLETAEEFKCYYLDFDFVSFTAPTIEGPTEGRPNKDYVYTFNSSYEGTGNIYYYIDWGDENNTGWIGPCEPLEKITIKKSWESGGDYKIKIIAKNEDGIESDWSKALWVMLRTKPKFLNFFENIYNLFPFIKFLLNIEL